MPTEKLPQEAQQVTTVTARNLSIGAREALTLLIQWKYSQPLNIWITNEKMQISQSSPRIFFFHFENCITELIIKLLS